MKYDYRIQSVIGHRNDVLEWLRSVEHDFEIADANSFSGQNLVIQLRPLHDIRVQFGLSEPLLLFYHCETSLQDFTQRAVNAVAAQEGADKYLIVIVSREAEARTSVAAERSRHVDWPVIVTMDAAELAASSSTSETVRRAFSFQLYSVDPFDERLPLRRRSHFFGRDQLLGLLISTAEKGRNAGVFGLRKMGKSSVLFAACRHFEKKGRKFCTVFWDCKDPAIRTRPGTTLLRHLFSCITGQAFPSTKNPWEISEKFTKGLHEWLSKKNRTAVVIMDEFEYISPFSPIPSTNWQQDFVDFWQVIWTYQSQYNDLSFLFGGVCAGPVETAVISGIQNPLFGIVSTHYLTGMTSVEVHAMITALGRPVGLRFTPDTAEALTHEYAGHPLLIRLACSLTLKATDPASRPVLIRPSELARDDALHYYGEHVVSELRSYYSDQYELLERLAVGDFHTFAEFAIEDDLVGQLRRYGLLRHTDSGRIEISIPIVRRYVRACVRRKEKSIVVNVVPVDKRAAWVRQAVQMFVREIEQLNRTLLVVGKRQVLNRGLGQVETLASTVVSSDEASHLVFHSQMYTVLFESVDDIAYVKSEFPALADSLERVRVYRHGINHQALSKGTEASRQRYLSRDLDAVSIGHPDAFFVLQQATLSNLLADIQVELARVTS